MAAATLPLSSATPAQAQPAAVQPQKLNRYFHIPAQSLVRKDHNGQWELSPKCKENLYRAAAFTFVAAFIALAVVAGAAAHLYAPGTFLVVTVTILPLTSLAYGVFEKLMNRANQQQELRLEEEGVHANLAALSSMNPKFEHSRIGIAYYRFWSQISSDLLKSIQETKKTLAKDPNPDATEIEYVGRRVIHLLDQARAAKLKTAYFYGLTLHPTDQRSLEEICSLVSIPYHERCYAAAAGRPLDAALRFADPKKGVITLDTFERLSIQELSTHLF